MFLQPCLGEGWVVSCPHPVCSIRNVYRNDLWTRDVCFWCCYNSKWVSVFDFVCWFPVISYFCLCSFCFIDVVFFAVSDFDEQSTDSRPSSAEKNYSSTLWYENRTWYTKNPCCYHPYYCVLVPACTTLWTRGVKLVIGRVQTHPYTTYQ